MTRLSGFIEGDFDSSDVDSKFGRGLESEFPWPTRAICYVVGAGMSVLRALGISEERNNNYSNKSGYNN